MRIGIDASLASRHGSGTGRYAARLIRHLVTLDRDNEYVLYFRSRDRAQNPLFDLAGPRVSPRVTDAPSTLLRLHLNMAVRLRLDGVDLYHSLGFFLPWLWRGKSVVTIHDIHPILLREHWGSRGTRVSDLALRAHIPTALRQACRVLVPSAYVKATIVERFAISPERVVVTPHGVDPFFQAPPAPEDVRAAERRLGGEPFLLYVGALAPHKNLTGLVRAFALVRAEPAGRTARLVIVGTPVGQYRDLELVPLIRRLGLDAAVVLAGYVDDTMLRAFYRTARAVVLPSFGEGFGLPVLEAMAAGAPVVTSAVSAMPEVAADAALYVDPRDADGLARAMTRVLTDEALRRDLSARGLARASTFTWERTARRVLRVYGEC